MTTLAFPKNENPTIGVELELALIDKDTLELSSSFDEIHRGLPATLRSSVKPEIYQCYAEVVSDIGARVDDVAADLENKLGELQAVADSLGIHLLWTGTHPFSSWKDQQVSDNPRYHKLIELFQDPMRQLVTFGLHVHVGVDSGDKAIQICQLMRRHVPLLLALSANSPFWDGRATGLHSKRIHQLSQIPLIGPPEQMEHWWQFVKLKNDWIESGYMKSAREVWWDVRPHHHFGTVETRICDIPPNLNHVLALTALVQCLVYKISTDIDEGERPADSEPGIEKTNRWIAVRYGVESEFIIDGGKRIGVQELADSTVNRLMPTADALDCVEHLQAVRELPGDNGAQRQLEIYRESNSLHEVVRRIIGANHANGYDVSATRTQLPELHPDLTYANMV